MQYSTVPFEIKTCDHTLHVEVGSLLERLQEVKDLRAKRGKLYPLTPFLAIAVLAKLGGQNHLQALAEWASLRAEELAQWFGLKRGTMPHVTTWARLLGQAVNPDQLQSVIDRFMAAQLDQELPKRGQVVLAIDGKTLRGTIPSGHTRGVHLMSAYLPKSGLVLGQVAVETKENEIVAAPRVLKGIDLRGMVVTGDAMQAQRALSTQVVGQGGDYLWLVKGNQKGVLADLEILFGPEAVEEGGGPIPTDFKQYTQWDKGHGRLEKRTIITSSWLKEYTPWPHLEQAFQLERLVYSLDGKNLKSREIRYGLSSLPAEIAGPAQLFSIARQEWGIENGLHHRKDVQLREDHCQLKKAKRGQINAILNNTVLGLMAKSGHARVAKARREFEYDLLKALALLTKRTLSTT